MPKQTKKLFLSLTTISNSSKSPAYRIFVDDTELIAPSVVEDLEPRKKNFIYTADFDNVKKITIELLNKEPSDTVVVDGKIVEDVLLIINQLKIDQKYLCTKPITKYLEPMDTLHSTVLSQLKFTKTYSTVVG